jgi:hypothetical protein
VHVRDRLQRETERERGTQSLVLFETETEIETWREREEQG